MFQEGNEDHTVGENFYHCDQGWRYASYLPQFSQCDGSSQNPCNGSGNVNMRTSEFP